MSMRKSTVRTKESSLQIGLQEFGWDAATIACLRHPTLPWFDSPAATIEVDAVPLAQCSSRGSRDRLSLLGQFAAHLAFLKFAGMGDESFRAEEWVAVFRRGEDCRLLRVKACPSRDDDAELSLIQSAASVLAAPALPVLRQSWGKAEHVYHEVDRLLRNESRADISWFRRCAAGTLRTSPPAVLAALAAGNSVRCEERAIIDALECWGAITGARPVVLGGPTASPLVPFSAVRPLLGDTGERPGVGRAAIAEAIILGSGGARRIVAVSDFASFDRPSREVLNILADEPDAFTWLVISDSEQAETLARRCCRVEAAAARVFVLAPRISFVSDVATRLRTIPEKNRVAFAERWVQSDSFSRFLDTGTIVPAPALEAINGIAEPTRSYLAAIALIGSEVDAAAASRLLAELGSDLPLEALMVEPVSRIADGRIRFDDPAAREALIDSMSRDTRRSLSRLASGLLESTGDRYSAASLACAAEDLERARSLLEAIPWWPDEWATILEKLETFPESAIRGSDVLCDVYSRAAIRAGRYRRARSFAELLPVPRRHVLCALAERRLGNYAQALELLRQSAEESFEPLLLEGELLRLTGESDLALKRFSLCAGLAETREQRVELGFHRALLSFDRGEAPDDSWIALTAEPERYLVERCLAYRHLAQREYAEASAHAAIALESAVDVPQAIDAALDVMESAFLEGNWDEARLRARQALALVEETEGDRAAGGILFLLAFLCADEGQWQQASRRMERLRDFYGSASDPLRLREIDLLEAHLALGQAQFAAARQKAAPLLGDGFSSEIREAAALILDEVGWIAGDAAALHSTGGSACAELTRRHLHQRARRAQDRDPGVRSPFARALLEWELGYSNEIPTAAAGSRSEKLQLFRALLASRSRGASVPENTILALADELTITSVVLPGEHAEQPTAKELRFLQESMLVEYPWPAAPIAGAHWRFATRNRLGQWNQFGSLPARTREELDLIARDGASDWIRVDANALLHVEGMDLWSAGSRRSAGELFRIRAENFNLKRALAQESDAVREAPETLPSGVVGQCSAMRELMALATKVARRDVPICILGESGTGKELVARAVHSESPRRSAPFTAVNCAALPENLIESELFGHVRGAFTGADRERAGLIESTDGGTLFLDEIGEMPLPAQAKLLRFLQEGEFRRVGESRLRQADVRVVAATNRKLEQFVEDAKFREDLYYRIRGIDLKVPPLRERGSDIILLARHFLAGERAKHRSGPDRFASEVEEVLLSYSWPGNVRELQNTVRAAHAIGASSREIELEHLPERLRGVVVSRVPVGTYFEELVRFRKTLVERSLVEAKGNQNQAAKLLGMSRQALAYQIRELGILVSRK